MKIHKFRLVEKTKDIYVQVYLTQEEYDNRTRINEINELEGNAYKIAYFICGKNNYPEILKKITFFEVTKNELS